MKCRSKEAGDECPGEGQRQHAVGDEEREHEVPDHVVTGAVIAPGVGGQAQFMEEGHQTVAGGCRGEGGGRGLPRGFRGGSSCVWH